MESGTSRGIGWCCQLTPPLPAILTPALPAILALPLPAILITCSSCSCSMFCCSCSADSESPSCARIDCFVQTTYQLGWVRGLG